MSRRIIILLVLSTVAAVTLIEVYLHAYMRSLPVISVAEAYQSAPLRFEATHVLSYNAYGCSANWLMLYRIEKPTSPHMNYAFFCFFKTAQNSSLLTQTLDILPVGIKPTSNDTGSHVHISLDEILFDANYTIVRVRYDFGEIGTYDVDFGLMLKIYSKTVLGHLPIDEIRISVGEILHYGP